MYQPQVILVSLILAVLTAPAAGHGQGHQEQPRPRPILLSTDIGADMDDQWVLAHLVLSGSRPSRRGEHSYREAIPCWRRRRQQALRARGQRGPGSPAAPKHPKVIAGSSDPLRQSRASPWPGGGFHPEGIPRLQPNPASDRSGHRRGYRCCVRSAGRPYLGGTDRDHRDGLQQMAGRGRPVQRQE